MQLLSKLYSQGSQQTRAGSKGLASLIPRLWPCFRHTLPSVRRGTLQCLSALLPDSAALQPAWLSEEQLTTAMRLTFQNLVMEQDDGILQASKHLWTRLLNAADVKQFAAVPVSMVEVRRLHMQPAVRLANVICLCNLMHAQALALMLPSRASGLCLAQSDTSQFALHHHTALLAAPMVVTGSTAC